MKFIFISLLGLVLSSALGQRSLLMLETRTRNRTVYYEIGDKISFYEAGRKKKREGVITELRDSTILFQNYSVALRDVVALHIDEKTRWWIRYKPAQLLLYSGTGYLLLTWINNEDLDEESLVIGGAILSTGLLLKILIPNRISIRRRTRLRIINL